ncbi:AEC family transporter [Uliginosibacterium sp. H1]|uniref:AEC family transporter n=1 Tax=Uliginosibacterium sp. H1 TaxID=3114757 RepID=UPI002E16F7EE|nr:AEC family transporter [Uliginosibacterium sp. H1]
MLIRIVSILFPVFAITAIGYFVARKRRPDMLDANRLTMDVFVPALIFGALASRDFDVAQFRWTAIAMIIVVALSGVVAWGLSRMLKVAPKTFVPPMMYGNSGNLGLPLAVLAFGQEALPVALILFMSSTLVHFTYGVHMLSPGARIWSVWQVPSVLATIAGLAVSLLDIELWPPLVISIRMLGDISIPLMLFALGVRMCDINFSAWRLGVIGGIARPVIGMGLSWLVGHLLGLQGQEMAMLLIYGALPPAVLNYIFAERYGQEPEHVASIVLIGNLFAVVSLPIALALTLH